MKAGRRTAARPDAGVLDDHRKLLATIERRGVLRGALSLGALSLLTGCDVSDEKSVQAALLAISAFNDRVQSWIFRPDRLAPTYPESMVLKPPRFNAYYPIGKLRPVDGATWRLAVTGRVSDRSEWTQARLARLPQTTEIIRHVCVEGWDYIGEWSGPTLRSFLEAVGADLRARYVTFSTADDYPSCIDMATALHPQTLLATGYARETLADPFGFPLRLRTSTKLGYKNPKWITSIAVTNDYLPGYWEKTGFNWFAGL